MGINVHNLQAIGLLMLSLSSLIPRKRTPKDYLCRGVPFDGGRACPGARRITWWRKTWHGLCEACELRTSGY